MSVRRFDIEAGGTAFAFKPQTEPVIDFWLGKYPQARKASAVIPLLWLAQKDNDGWLSEPAMRLVADRLEMPYMRVYEVATFYTMFQLQPVGRHHVQLCGTTPCMLRGANELKKVCEKKIGAKMQVTDDGRLSWQEVECLGACVNAPMVQINDDYYEDLTPEILADILERLTNGVEVAPGTFADRINSAPQGGLTSLTDETLFDGSRARKLSQIPNAPQREGDALQAEAAGSPERAAPTNTAREAKPAEEAVAAANEAIKDGAEPAQADGDVEAVGAVGADLAGERPASSENLAPGVQDDLKRISGIGPKIEQTLNALGIYTFAQIAAWTPENEMWVDGYLSFRGRVAREEWIAQAGLLADGGETEFSKRVDRGDVGSSRGEDA